MPEDDFRTHLNPGDLEALPGARRELGEQLGHVVAAYGSAELPGLHPLEIAEAATLGFSEFQAEAVLHNPLLLDRLRRLWSGAPPGPRIERIAAGTGERARLHAALLAAAAPDRGPRVLRVLPAVTDLPMAAAAADRSARPHSEIDAEHRFRITRTPLAEEARLHLVLEFARAADLHVTRLTVGPRELVLFVVLEQQGTLAVGESFLELGSGWGSIAVGEPAPALALPAAAADLTRSVAVCDPGVKGVWRRLAATLPAGHWMRGAIAAGLP
ncbi:hypothetical protein [Nocardia harenae]|uniref:hypothetical protein n=1 Tax=Nocardia harenae TaxID=358707 RepID=UPI00082F90C3|nr:hypothetical protein [Nocardia harenae]